MTIKRMAPLTGLAFVILLVITFVVLGGGGSTPPTSASGATIGSFYIHHHDSAEAAAYLLPVAVVLLVTFAATTWPILQRRSRIWSTVFLGGALVTAACLVVAAASHYALAQAAHDGLDPSALQAINALDQPASDAFAAIAIMLVGAAGALIPNRVRHLRYLGYIAVALASICLSPAGTTLFPLTALWIATFSVMLCSRSNAEVTTSSAPGLAITNA